MATLCERMQQIMKEKNISPSELAQRTGIDRGTIWHYARGDYEPKLTRLSLLARGLDCSNAYLMGLDVDPKRDTEPEQPQSEHQTNCINLSLVTNTQLMREFKYVASCIDDGMAPDNLTKGSQVYISESDLKDGDIIAVVKDSKCIFRRIYHLNNGNFIVLVASNTKYEPMVFTPETRNQVEMIGKVEMVDRRILF